MFDWRRWARPLQIAPDSDWLGWLQLGGRGGGKTRSGAEWVRENVENGTAKRIALIGETSADGKDVMVNGESGIIAVSPPWNKPEFTASSSNGRPKLTWPNGAIATLYDAREPDQLRGPQHDLCFVAGTLVQTQFGPIPIEEVRIGTMVLTRNGLRAVEQIGSREENTGIVSFNTNTALCGTAEHPIFTSNGWTRMSDLRLGDIVCAIDALNGEGSVGIHTLAGTWNTEAQDASTGKTGIDCIERCGGLNMAQSPQGMKSTTWTRIYSITLSAILRVWRRGATAASTLHQSLSKRLIGRASRCAQFIAQIAALALNAGWRSQNIFAFAAPGSGQRQNENYRRPVITAESSSFLVAGTIAASVVSTWAPAGKAKVFNLQVEGEQEYFANGILVHNCWLDELAKYRYAQAVFDNLLMGLRLGDNPRWLATTTPRPIALIKALMKDNTVVVTRYSSTDNIQNLAMAYRRNVIDRYAGTRLGRQEIDAEILEDIPGALWSRRNLDENRVRIQDVPPLTRVKVSIDPAITSGESSNEHGIMVGGMCAKQHGYLLEDASLRGTPDQMARRAVAMYRKYEADGIVAEANQGGEMVTAIIRAVDPSVPVKLVRATRGKYVRAEPASALYEQGRISHVGTFAELEDQQIAFTPESAADRLPGESPDRVDALVWLWADLFDAMTVPQRHDRDAEDDWRMGRGGNPYDGRSPVTGY